MLAKTPGVDIYQVTIGSTGDLFGPGGGTNASSSRAAFTILTDPRWTSTPSSTVCAARSPALHNVGTVTVTGEDRHSWAAVDDRGARLRRRPLVLKQANDLVLQRVKTVSGLAEVTSNLSRERAAGLDQGRSRPRRPAPA